MIDQLLRRSLAAIALSAGQGLAAGPGLAQAGAPTLTRAESLLAQGRAAQALTILETLPPGADTVLRLTWARAAAHLQLGEPRAALPFLERLVLADPGNARFRLELGRALFLVGQDDRARFQFQQARAAPLSPQARATADQYLTALDRRRTTTTFLSFGLRPSDNPGNRTSATTVTVADGVPVTLNPNARKQSGTALAFGAGVVARPVLGRDLRGRFSLSGEAELYDRGAENALTLSGEAGIEALGDRNRSLGLGLFHVERFEQGAGAYGQTGVFLAFARSVGAAGQISLRAEHGYRDYRRRGDLDGARSSVALRYVVGVSPRLALRAGLTLEQVDATDPSQRHRKGELSLGGTYGFDGGLVLGIDLSHGQTRYEGVSTLFGAARTDTLTTLGLSLHHRAVTYGGFAPVLSVRRERNDSTLPFHAYATTRIALGLTREF